MNTCQTKKDDNLAASISSWFKNEEFYWRSVASCIWLMMILPFSLLVLIVLINFSIWTPIAWITDSLMSVFSFYTIALCFAMQVCSILITFGHSRALTALCIHQLLSERSIPDGVMSIEAKSEAKMNKLHWANKTKFLQHFIRPKQLFTTLCFLLSCAFLSYLSLWISLSNDRKTYDHTLGFLFPYGLFLGVLYSINFYRQHEYVAHFPIIQQKRFFRVKKVIVPCVKESVAVTFKAMQLFYPMYFLISYLPAVVVNVIFDYNIESDSFVSTLFKLCSISLFWSCFCTSVFLVFIFKMANYMLKISNTQLFSFPMEAQLMEEQGHTLCDAMQSDNLLLKHLACLDYSTLSSFPGPRRLKLFELSPPGNQAHVWNKTTIECMRTIESLRSKLTMVFEQKQQEKLHQQVSSPPISTVGERHLFSPNKTLFSPNKSMQKDHLWKSPGRGASSSTGVTGTPVSSPNVHSNLKLQESNKCDEHCTFQSLQLSIWCIEGLCNVVAASVTDDKYGVVQRKLPDILTELLLLLEACNSYTKVFVSPSSLNKSGPGEFSQENALNAASLKLAVKSGLYTITTAFGYHISAVRLSTDLKKRLHSFLEYAE